MNPDNTLGKIYSFLHQIGIPFQETAVEDSGQ